MDAMLFRGLPLAKHSDRLLYLAMRKPTDLACCPGPIRFADFEAWRTQSRAFEGLAFGRNGEPITFREGAGRAIDMTVSRRSANTFGLLGVQPILGRDFMASDEAPGAPPVVILSHQFWERRFGKRADIVGAIVHINGAPATIVGVMPEGFALVYEQDLWMPLAITPGLEGGAIGRLRDDATIEQARAELDAITRGLQAADPATVRGVPSVSSYSQAHVAPDAPMIYRSLWAGAWFVLLIACANLANLTLVRTVGRGREFSTRIALGAGQWRLIRQMLIESVALTSVAAALAWSLTSWSVRTWADATASRYLALDYTLNSSTVMYLCAIAATSAILIAMLPIARVRQLGAQRRAQRRCARRHARAPQQTPDGVAGVRSDGTCHGPAAGRRRARAQLREDRRRRDRRAPPGADRDRCAVLAERHVPDTGTHAWLFSNASIRSCERLRESNRSRLPAPSPRAS